VITTNKTSRNVTKQWDHFKNKLMKISNFSKLDSTLLFQATASLGVSFVTHLSANSIKVDQWNRVSGSGMHMNIDGSGLSQQFTS
jgi:hypothetical protein